MAQTVCVKQQARSGSFVTPEDLPFAAACRERASIPSVEAPDNKLQGIFNPQDSLVILIAR